ncbi:MAG: hypothetical protein ACRENU_03855 [Gemmatimonadaceae bacterium]
MTRTIGARNACHVAVALCTTALGACTSFSSVRNANVAQGPSLFAQANVSSPPGKQATWFFTLCETVNCNHPIPGGDVNLSFGSVGNRAPPFAVGLAINGVFPFAGMFPYLEVYVQLRRSPSASGLGVRIGIPMENWSQHQLYMRFNKRMNDSSTFLWNPGLVLHTGRSPNGENPGTFLGLVSGFGYEFYEKGVALTPSVSIVVSHAQHETFSESHGPEVSVFAVGGLSLTFRRRPP